MGVQGTLKTDAQLTEAREPGMRSLDHPSIPAQALIAFDPFASDTSRDASRSQVVPAPRVIVVYVGVQFYWGRFLGLPSSPGRRVIFWDHVATVSNA